MSGVRLLKPEDLPDVARLFSTIFLKENGNLNSLETYLYELYFQDPWANPECSSRVYISEQNKIIGFIGVLPSVMQYEDRQIQAAAAGSLMVENPQDNPLAGAKLLRAFLNGPQEFSYSETSNPLSRPMWEKSGGHTLTSHSMEWIRLLRPAGTIAAILAHKLPWMERLHFLSHIPDSLINNLASQAFTLKEPPAYIYEQNADKHELVTAIKELSSLKKIHPHWNDQVLEWRLEHASRKMKRGPVQARIIRGRNNLLIGWYIYHGRKGNFAHVLDMSSRPGEEENVLGCLIRTAKNQGCVAIRGKTQSEWIMPLLDNKAFLVHRSSTTVHTRNNKLLADIKTGNIAINGLAAENWIRLIGDEFQE